MHINKSNHFNKLILFMFFRMVKLRAFYITIHTHTHPFSAYFQLKVHQFFPVTRSPRLPPIRCWRSPSIARFLVVSWAPAAIAEPFASACRIHIPRILGAFIAYIAFTIVRNVLMYTQRVFCACVCASVGIWLALYPVVIEYGMKCKA